MSWNVPLPESTLKVNGACYRPSPILHPSFMEIHSVVFVLTCCPTNQLNKNYFEISVKCN